MRLSIFACTLGLIALGGLSQATDSLSGQSSEPPKYPVGQYCTPKGDIVRGKQTDLHPCECKRHDDIDAEDPEVEGKHKMCKAGEATNPSHDARCKQWCNEQQCACPISCETQKGKI